MQVEEALAHAEHRRRTSGARLEPPMPSSTAWRVPLGPQLVDERRQALDLVAHSLGTLSQPSELPTTC